MIISINNNNIVVDNIRDNIIVSIIINIIIIVVIIIIIIIIIDCLNIHLLRDYIG